MHCRRERRIKINKGHKDQKGRSFLFVDGIIVYVENPSKSRKQLLELITELSKITGHKIIFFKKINALFYILAAKFEK